MYVYVSIRYSHMHSFVIYYLYNAGCVLVSTSV